MTELKDEIKRLVDGGENDNLKETLGSIDGDLLRLEDEITGLRKKLSSMRLQSGKAEEFTEETKIIQMQESGHSMGVQEIEEELKGIDMVQVQGKEGIGGWFRTKFDSLFGGREEQITGDRFFEEYSELSPSSSAESPISFESVKMEEPIPVPIPPKKENALPKPPVPEMPKAKEEIAPSMPIPQVPSPIPRIAELNMLVPSKTPIKKEEKKEEENEEEPVKLNSKAIAQSRISRIKEAARKAAERSIPKKSSRGRIAKKKRK